MLLESPRMLRDTVRQLSPRCPPNPTQILISRTTPLGARPETALLKLGKLPDVIGKGGTLGTIVEWLEVMRTWVSEEMESTRGSSDIIVDRLTFAAMVSTPEPAPISCSHMNIPRLPLTGHPTLGEAARRIHRTRYADGGDDQEGQEGARKGDEQGGGCGTASPNRR